MAQWLIIASFFTFLLLSPLTKASLSQPRVSTSLILGGGFHQDSIQKPLRVQSSLTPLKLDSPPQTDVAAAFDTYATLLDALEVMQSRYFIVWRGAWPEAIDWTAAVLGTFVSGVLSSMSQSLDYIVPSATENALFPLEDNAQELDNLINHYFNHLVAFFFGQNTFSLRHQAYDDMLWVVLGWIEAIKFVRLHSALHYESKDKPWYGRKFISGFRGRVHEFYELASNGWDTTLCSGGMLWSPYLRPYKNAITNELYITASINIYLYLPGNDDDTEIIHDRKYLESAQNAYKWLTESNMTNFRGLYTDGYHIKDSGNLDYTNTACDDRNEMVYSYNQGVLLSGLRGLWESTGDLSYLEDGHSLIRSTVRSTGFSIEGTGNKKGWSGLGRDGVLEEACDSYASCTQNCQTFKGIFFFHLTLFCAALPAQPITSGKTFAANSVLRSWHRRNCALYGEWIARNAEAAMESRDSERVFGEWWGTHNGDYELEKYASSLPAGAIDYVNQGMPTSWLGEVLKGAEGHLTHGIEAHVAKGQESDNDSANTTTAMKDPNTRGRGRTVETQSGGIAVLRALLEIVERQ
ncbi:MAG: hypothetical protein M1829_005142 [Trizodia sp. TS-e1964]|nr:MAG: hypothetical protein M1829_005142 [Trizodia sp. TS-e1964]